MRCRIVALLLVLCHGSVLEVSAQPGGINLDQNWKPDQVQKFWWTSQGSRLLPYEWFNALEQAHSETRFADKANMEGLGYIPQSASTLNPAGLPIGFALDVASKGDGSRAVGFTCAACHTQQLRIGGTDVIVDGGPTIADFSRFMAELVEALDATASDARQVRAVRGQSEGQPRRPSP